MASRSRSATRRTSMDSNYPLLAQPLWFGTPWHGTVYLDGSNATRLRPNGTTGDKDRAWSGTVTRDTSLWDIGKPDPVTPDEILAQAGAFLGRSLVSPSLNAWRPLLLDGTVCRVRVREDFALGFVAEVRAYDPATGVLKPAVIASTGRFSMTSIGQGADQPSVSEWVPPDIIRSYTCMDVTSDGRSMLVGVTPFVSQLEFTPVAGLVRLDIGGTAQAPTLTISLISSRADALGEASWNNEFTAQNQSWGRAPAVSEDNECGTWRTTKHAALHPESTTAPPGISASGIVTRTGASVTTRSFSGRILTAWLDSAGQVEIVRYSFTATSSYTVSATDESTGSEVTTNYFVPDSCVLDYTTVENDMVMLFKVSTVSESSGTLTVGSSTAAFTFSVTNNFTWDNFTSEPKTRERITEGTLDGVSGSELLSGIADLVWMPSSGPVEPTVLRSWRDGVREQALPSWYALHPSHAGWKAAALSRTRVQSGDVAVDVKLWPASTPSGVIGGTITYLFPVAAVFTSDNRRIASSNGAFNPISGAVMRGSPGAIRGCV